MPLTLSLCWKSKHHWCNIYIDAMAQCYGKSWFQWANVQSLKLPKILLSSWPRVETNKFDDYYAFAFDMSIVSICLLFVGLHILGRLTYSLQERWSWSWQRASRCCCCTWWRPPPQHSPPAQDFLATALRLFLDRWKPQFHQNQLPPTKAKYYKLNA